MIGILHYPSIKNVGFNEHYLSYIQFEVEANDQGSPPKTRRSRAVVVFKRDSPPRFENLPRTQPVSENAANNSVVYRAQGRDDDKRVTAYLLLFLISLWLFCWRRRVSMSIMKCSTWSLFPLRWIYRCYFREICCTKWFRQVLHRTFSTSIHPMEKFVSGMPHSCALTGLFST